MITNSKDDTATWNCGRWTWTIGLPLVAMFLVATVAGQDGFVFIGGNSHKRVIPCAKKLGARYFVPTHQDAPLKVMMKENRQWIDEMMNAGVPIIDLGPDPRLGKIGQFYDMELNRVRSDERSYREYYPVTKLSETEDNTTPQLGSELLQELLQAAQDCARGGT